VKAGPLAAAAVIAAAVFASHYPLLRARYVQDDHVAVEHSPVVASGDPSAIVGASYWEGARGGDRTLYRPVTVATYAAERAATGTPNPHVSHTINLILHAAVSWLLFLVAVRVGLDPWAAAIAALLFAVTPSKAEAVANVVGRAELLAALFSLGAVRLSLETGRRAAAWGAAACVLLACASKGRASSRSRSSPLPRLRFPGGAGSTLRTWSRPRSAFRDLRRLAAPSARGLLSPASRSSDLTTLDRGAACYLATALESRRALPPHRRPAVPVGQRLFHLVRFRSSPPSPRWAARRARRSRPPRLDRDARPRRGALRAVTLLPYLLVSNLLVPSGVDLRRGGSSSPRDRRLSARGARDLKLGRRVRVALAVVVVVLGAAMFLRSLDWRTDSTIFAATSEQSSEPPRVALAQETG
jgi:hypothetical protein